jgi:hypothetical protein
MFADDLMIIDRLRSEAVNVQEPHVSGISRLVTYAAQLKWLGGKFPIDVRGLAPTPLLSILPWVLIDWLYFLDRSRFLMVSCVRI